MKRILLAAVVAAATFGQVAQPFLACKSAVSFTVQEVIGCGGTPVTPDTVWIIGDPVQAAVEGEDLILLRPDGKELKAKITRRERAQ